jgi:hypothetical protein
MMTIFRSPKFLFAFLSLIILDFFGATAQTEQAAWTKAEPAVTLVYADTLTLPSFKAFDLPVRIKSAYDISAISLGFYYPGEYLVIDTMEMIHGTTGYYYNITDTLFNMAWSNVQPLHILAGDTIIILKMNTLDMSALSNTLKLELYPFSEFADASANIIEGVVLEVPEIEFMQPDPGDSIDGNYINIYPNPFKDNTTLYFTLKAESQVSISIFNPTGMESLRYEEKTYPQGSYQVKIDGIEFSKGIYLLKFEIKNSETDGNKIFKLLNCR